MTTINLLPWRFERRVRREKAFYCILALVVMGSLLLALGVWVYYDGQIKEQRVRNEFLMDEVRQVDAQAKQFDLLDQNKKQLLSRISLIEDLLVYRAQVAHLFDALARSIPDGVVLSNIKQNGSVLTLQGRSQSDAVVSVYMRNLEATGWMSKPELLSIDAERDQQAEARDQTNIAPPSYVFTLQVELAMPLNDNGLRVSDPPLMSKSAMNAPTTLGGAQREVLQ